MKIAGYQGTTLIDWPGKIASIIFVPGCNFRCPFCHNADLVDPQKIKKQSPLSEKEIWADLAKRRQWIDGVAMTGGEPTLQPDLPAFLDKLKKLGFATMIETNGTAPEVLNKLLAQKPRLLDYLSLDFKAPLDKTYAKTVGLKSFDPEIWLKSLKIILKAGLPFELRTTVVPTIHDEKALLRMARQILRLTSHGSRITSLIWFLQTFQPKNCLDPKFTKLKPYSRMEMESFLRVVKKIIPGVELRS